MEAKVAKTRLLEAIAWLATGLADDNEGRAGPERLRLRASLHAGEVLRDPEPLYGEAVVFACRLLDAELLRECLRTTGRPLALIVSQTIYDDVLRHHFPRLDPGGYHPVIARTKEARRRAWVHVPGDEGAPVRAGVVASPADLALGEGPIPRNLPPDATVFTGREQELERLRALLASEAGTGAARAVVLHGPAGVGKSALAVRVAHQLAESYPDGQLYVDLRGPTPGLARLEPVTVLQRFLRGFGLTGTAVPAALPEAATTFHSLAANRRLLLILDNADGADQVRPLLPGHPGCAAIVTSRVSLGQLDGAAWLGLDLLDTPAAVNLLRLLVGPERVDREPEAAAEIARHCGNLPLALRIVGARARLYPSWTLDLLAERLADEHRRLDELRLGDLGVRASFQLSYQALQEGPAAMRPAARLFRLLSVLDGGDFAAPVARALLDEPPAVVDAALERLVEEQLVVPLPDGRYRPHDLIRLFSTEKAADEPPARLAGARLRMLRFLLATTRRAGAFLRPDDEAGGAAGTGGWPEEPPGGDERPGGGGPGAGEPEAAILPLDSRRAALDWLDAERVNLVATASRAGASSGTVARLGAALAEALVDYLEVRSAFDDWDQLNQVMLRVGRERGPGWLEGAAWNAVGRLALRRRALAPAEDAFRRALDLRRAAGDRPGEASSLRNLGIVYRLQERNDDAITCYEGSLAIDRSLGLRLRVGQTLGNLGNAVRGQARLDEARRCYEESLAICEEYDDWRATATALHGLGQVHHARGQPDLATAYFQRQLVVSGDLGDLRNQADALFAIGEVRRGQGQLDAAVRAYHAALSLQRETRHQHEAATTLWKLGLARSAQGNAELARQAWRESLTLFEHLGTPEAGQVRALL